MPASLNRPIVGMATTPDGGGYWLVASDGGIFMLRRRPLLRQSRRLTCSRSTSPSSAWCPPATGGATGWSPPTAACSAFGDAGFYGSLGASPPPTPIVGVAPTPDGGGYWMLEADGTVHAFGDAPGVGPVAESPGPAVTEQRR